MDFIYSSALEGNNWYSFQVIFCCYHTESHSGHTQNCSLCDDGALIWVIWKNTILEVVTNAVLDAIFERPRMRGTKEAWESTTKISDFQFSHWFVDNILGISCLLQFSSLIKIGTVMLIHLTQTSAMMDELFR